MAVVKPSISKGTRDFTPQEMIRRNYIFNTIRSVFEKYAYLPIETPSMENLSTLMGKYGEEGDRLIFKILNSGDFTKDADMSLPPNQLAAKICEKGLRYDLTVPFARFVVMHQNDLTFPFKRYQMQPVWRADRPQKGRYREFYQCDVDVIGSNSLLYEAELMKITDEVFNKLGVNVTIHINNRKILMGVAALAGAEEKMVDICTAIDKLDKIGKENVIAELRERGLTDAAIDKLLPIFDIQGDNDHVLQTLRSLFADIPVGMQGVEELEQVLDFAKMYAVDADIRLEILLARGLNYYTGAIFEVRANDVQIGSISGGGRYDDLTGVFGLKNMSGVGISYGAERIYDVMQELDLFPPEIAAPVKAIILNFGEKEVEYAMPLLVKMRAVGIASEIYPDKVKIGKQMNYANAKAIPYVIMAGEEEMTKGVFTVKNMTTGEQRACEIDEVLEILRG
ncbi:histidine--tRNA ligase [Bacteroidales bacterium OttesenSCG-928-B11]|nr:histidine--tRNA ligase [Bacteroidales bacterium OttesenSCG-928-C03]MDL2312710.1 histidine--tRNA ligase [Bacteroidales bacterium OttesenSCG-928-B11]MDL2326270.1 histidine--tRNA ligase [Bacteroidales bacterium OttesenSCG-928-A14]